VRHILLPFAASNVQLKASTSHIPVLFNQKRSSH
jgi:hypothetical protein